jgi:hypothetical protein
MKNIEINIDLLDMINNQLTYKLSNELCDKIDPLITGFNAKNYDLLSFGLILGSIIENK